jgi:hypothetical protein
MSDLARKPFLNDSLLEKSDRVLPFGSVRDQIETPEISFADPSRI